MACFLMKENVYHNALILIIKTVLEYVIDVMECVRPVQENITV